jgi:phenylpropionate dioxygenase-like ring-hydroxylating dioxygenase large terminal subunit
MSRPSTVAPFPGGRTFPLNSWYVAANSAEVTRQLLARRMLDIPVVLFRTRGGQVTALEDRCAHRAFPLSKGRLDGDRVICGYHGLEYNPAGLCVRVPSQAEVPFGARVRSFPVHDDRTFVWIWGGDPGLARLRRPPEIPWLADPGWATFGGQHDVAADYLLLHETFADVTHVPFIHAEIAPLVLKAAPPPLEVEVTETSVALSRAYPPAPLPEWHWRTTTLEPGQSYEQREAGRFAAPGLWVDQWDVHAVGTAGERVYSLRFTQAVTPVTTTSSGLVWRVSRDFGLEDAAVDSILQPLFTQYYAKVKEVMETVQATIDDTGDRRDVDVDADRAALHVRKIIRAMVSEETGHAARGPLAHANAAATTTGA